MTDGSPPQGQAGMRLHADDLIDDRELNDADDDRLSHQGIADQLAAIARTVDAPANIALYGPWGSGKSGIGNLLKKQVDGVDGARFARFDAYKYAELPLQRNFVSAVATELGQTKSTYHDDLYNGRTKTDITVPAATILKILGIFALLISGLSVILLGLVALVAWVQDGDFGSNFESYIGTALKAGLVPAALLSGLVALATKTFQVDRSIAKPESDEQFEKLFSDLVNDSRAKRLVVFVDELDRCSASEVVETLDTVRTFLGVSKCVFVIAADRHVLEEALSRAAKQETPANDDNPYYSTGSAYLDKVFQYQVSLPPLLTQSISNYATNLIKDRGGLWGDINTAYVLSVLIPTHVTSPRRVKHLINTFALTYRLAEQRHESGLLAEDPKLHAPAIAKLACLRVEFPLFARHIEVDANLPALVLDLVKDPKKLFGPGVSDRARDLAVAYALENAAPASMLNADLNTRGSADADPEDAEDADDAGDAGDVGDGPSHDHSAESGSDRTVMTHNQQLINYLRRTNRVNGPSRALVYQQTSGTVLGLDGEIAASIEAAAENKDLAGLRRIIDGLDDDGQAAAFDLLAQHIRTGLGLAGPNSARSLLLLHEQNPDFTAGRSVDSVCESIANLYDDDPGLLDEETIEGAWSLSKRGSDSGALALRSLIVADLAYTWDSMSPEFLLGDARLAIETNRPAAADYIGNHLVSSDGPRYVETLFQMNDDDLIRTIDDIGAALTSNVRDADATHRAWKSKVDAAAKAATAATTSGVAVTPEPADLPGSEPFDPSPLLTAFAQHAVPRETPVQHRWLRFLFAVDTMEARDSALTVLTKTEAVTDPDLATSVLDAMRRRNITTWVPWAKGINPAAISTVHASLLFDLCQKVWAQHATDKIGTAHAQAALDVLRPLRETLADNDKPDLTNHVLDDVEFIANDSDEAQTLLDTLAKVDILVSADLVGGDVVATKLVGATKDILAADVAVVEPADPLRVYLRERCIPALRVAHADPPLIDDLVSEASTCPWMREVQRTHTAFLIIEASGINPTALSNVPTPDAIADLAYNWGSEATPIATLWVKLTSPTQDQVAPVVERLRSEGALTSEFADAVAQVRQNWSMHDRETFARRYLTTPDELPLLPVDARLVGLPDLDDARAAAILTDLYAQTSNNTQRRHLVDLWATAQVTSDRVRRELIEAVVYDLLKLNMDGRNTQAAELALDTIQRIGNPLPRNIKTALGENVDIAVGTNKSLNNKALRVMAPLGYTVNKSGLFGRKKRVNYKD